MNTNQIYFLEKPNLSPNARDKNVLYLAPNEARPRKADDAFWFFVKEKGLDKLENFEIINIAIKNGAIIDNNFSYYKTHTGITINNQVYVCEHNDYTQAYFFKILYFLGIIEL